MTACEPLRFHVFDERHVVVSRGGTRAMRISLNSNSMDMAVDLDYPDTFGNEVVYSHRPIQVDEKVCLRFGPSFNSCKFNKIRSIVTLGFTKHSPNNLISGLSSSELKSLPGYWVSEQPIDNRTRLHFSVNSSGEIHFSDRGQTCTGPRVGEINTHLWAVVTVPKYGIYVEFDPKSVATRGLNRALCTVPVSLSQSCGNLVNMFKRSSDPVNSSQQDGVPVRVSQRGTCSIPMSSSQSPRTTDQHSSTNQSKDRETLPKEDTARGDLQTSTGSECIICYNEPLDTALFPCGHMYTCYICALDLWEGRGEGTCPTCRKEITNVLRIYRD